MNLLRNLVKSCCLSMVAGAACGPAAEEPVAAQIGTVKTAVVGGRQEAGYTAAGYIVVGAVGAAPANLNCSAVQVGPHLVLTAAHCFMNWDASPVTSDVANRSWGFGRGEVANAERFTASRVIVHPSYDPNAANRFDNDLALVVFDRPIGGRWAEIDDPLVDAACGTAKQGTAYTYVGYGRDTAGGSSVPGNVFADRKSATQCISDVTALSLDASGVSGGLCWGDSGGPLFQTGKSTVVGVLSDFDGVFDCQVGNDMIFTQLASYERFICDATPYVGEGKFCGRSFVAEVMAVL